MSGERRSVGPRGPMGHGRGMSGEKARDFKGTLKKLFRYMDKYKISAGSRVRILDPTKVVGELELYGYPLPDTFAVGDTIGCFTITEIIGNKLGAVVKVTA